MPKIKKKYPSLSYDTDGSSKLYGEEDINQNCPEKLPLTISKCRTMTQKNRIFSANADDIFFGFMPPNKILSRFFSISSTSIIKTPQSLYLYPSVYPSSHRLCISLVFSLVFSFTFFCSHCIGCYRRIIVV